MVEMSVVDLREIHKWFEMQVLCHNILFYSQRLKYSQIYLQAICHKEQLSFIKVGHLIVSYPFLCRIINCNFVGGT